MTGYQQSLVWIIGFIMAGSAIIAWAHAWRRVNLAKILGEKAELIRKDYTWKTIPKKPKQDSEGYDLDEDDV